MTDMMNLLEDFYDGLNQRTEVMLRHDASKAMMIAAICFMVLPLIMISVMVIL